MIWMSVIVLIALLSSSFILSDISAEEPITEEPIIITEARPIQEIDGKWGTVTEWKESSYRGLSYDNGGKFILRTSHDRNYIYVLVNHIGDTFPNKGEDKATVCLSSKNSNPEKNDYCFIVTLSRKNSIILEENTSNVIKSKFKRIFKTEFEGMGDITMVDRYSTLPHVTYEFKIPIDLVGRSNEYQFYVAVYEAHNNYVLTWPKNIILENNFEIPHTSKWGKMISPDKSLPEFHYIYFTFMIPLLLIIMLRTQKWHKVILIK